MSIKIQAWVWENAADVKGTDLLMLLAIADHANDEGICWPSVGTLAAKCRVSERQAQYIISRLEAADILEIERGVGRNHTSLYTIKGAADCTITTTERVQPTAPIRKTKVQPTAPIGEIKGAIQREKVQSSAEKVQPIAPEPSIEPPITTTIKQQQQQRLSSSSSERPAIYETYEQEIGLLTPMVSDMIADDVKTYGEQWIEDAIRVAAGASKREYRYVQAVLRNWKQRGRGDTQKGNMNGDHRDGETADVRESFTIPADFVDARELARRAIESRRAAGLSA